MIDEEQAADLLIEFGRSHGAFSMVRGDRPVIDDYDASIEFVLSDDTGMDTYDHNSHFRHFLCPFISGVRVRRTSPRA